MEMKVNPWKGELPEVVNDDHYDELRLEVNNPYQWKVYGMHYITKSVALVKCLAALARLLLVSGVGFLDGKVHVQ